MPSTVYKGDLAEVAFAPQPGMRIVDTTITQGGCSYNNDPTITCGAAAISVGMPVSGSGIPAAATVASITTGVEGQSVTEFELSASTTGGSLSGQTLTFKPVEIAIAANGVLEITGGASNSPVLTNFVQYPLNMLVGSKLVFIKATGAVDAADVDGRVFTIVSNVPSESGTKTSITIHPVPASSVGALGEADGFEILPFCTPPLDPSMSYDDAATDSSESCKIDQFLGIASAITLPETKMDLKRFHVVGLGRDVSVQAPGKFMTEGGSFEVNMHTARWLKYCLGQEAVNHSGAASSHRTELALATSAGQSHIKVDDIEHFAVGKYVLFTNGTAVPIVSDHEPDAGTWSGTAFSGLFDKATPKEVRRIVGLSANKIVHLDEPLAYSHAAGGSNTLWLIDYATSGNNPPSLASATGTLTNPIYHLLYSMDTVPSFCLEVSQRRRNVDSEIGTHDGTATDSKELTRVYRGCKVKDFTLSTDNDAALKLAVNFDSALCYTDTGRLEGTPGSRYNAHRMFDDTASTALDRRKSGIEIGSQKPFMFYNGSVTLAGQTVGQVISFSLSGNTGVTSHYSINGSDIASASTDQVPFAGARNPVVLVEGQTEYNLDMEIIVDDPIFFHKMRTATEYTNSAGNQILLTFNKNGSGGTREKMAIIIDDYYITEAPVQIPEDKGVVKSALKVMPKAIKVVSRDSILKY